MRAFFHKDRIGVSMFKLIAIASRGEALESVALRVAKVAIGRKLVVESARPLRKDDDRMIVTCRGTNLANLQMARNELEGFSDVSVYVEL